MYLYAGGLSVGYFFVSSYSKNHVTEKDHTSVNMYIFNKSRYKKHVSYK